ncbi:hypothetical protein GLOTRDRAFT_138843 [Gloeophyllum trabeum ATCC 11539]|uniref:F-box domain-containing protein n=1 Tax=Gloeophyllum trabeum (strain ATCC 11539 / FP-39264 / Madison 617) TaxID=670483 RepID=S7RLE4_GLOTA|nr:uncharacterized protein GLOTRDRAFT_138843 [Gloeophyllum trabeum ATCC 11539]EPQ55225.1 hypothetical protein GLOTRDRAFT_138843 [Gloeophyllum trabeum ATCC 11539]
MRPFIIEQLPVDLLYPIFEELDRKDLHSATLLSKKINPVATSILYRTLDSRTTLQNGIPRVLHPATTLLKRPELTKCVRHVREQGSILTYYPDTLEESLAALKLCTNLHTFSWIDDTFAEDTFLSFLRVLKSLPLQGLTIRTSGDLGDTVWAKLQALTGLRRIAIWSMEGPPRVLKGWAQHLSGTLTHLELGRCAGVPATILISVFCQLPLLVELRLKGAPPAAIPLILSYLPNLRSLDVEYLGAGKYRAPTKPLPRLRTLVVRTSSMDADGPSHLWPWILELIPRTGLESFTLHAFTVLGGSSIPLSFVISLLEIHEKTLRQFMVGTTHLRLTDLEHLCGRLPALEDLACSVASADAAAIGRAVAKADHLRSLRLQVLWLPSTHIQGIEPAPRGGGSSDAPFSLDDARAMMLRRNSQLRLITIGPVAYKGMWVPKYESDGKVKLEFEISRSHDGYGT